MLCWFPAPSLLVAKFAQGAKDACLSSTYTKIGLGKDKHHCCEDYHGPCYKDETQIHE